MDNNLPKPGGGGFVPPPPSSNPAAAAGRVKAPQQVVYVSEENKPHFPYMDGRTFLSLVIGIVTSLAVTGAITFYLLSIKPPEEEAEEAEQIAIAATPTPEVFPTDTPIPTPTIDPFLTVAPSPAAQVTSIPQQEPVQTTSKSFASTAGQYSFEYPTTYTVTENPASAAKGGQNPANTVQIASQTPYFTVNITHKNVGTITSLNDYMRQEDYCAAKYPESQTSTTVDGQQALLYADIPCGQYGSSAIVVYKSPFVYDIIVTNQVSYSTIKADIESLLATMQFN
jgi:Rieske Fe-S protein